MLNFYMGKHTPERKDYMTDKFVVPVEDAVKELGGSSGTGILPVWVPEMAKHTPERKDYIMDKLVVPVEE